MKIFLKKPIFPLQFVRFPCIIVANYGMGEIGLERSSGGAVREGRNGKDLRLRGAGHRPGRGRKTGSLHRLRCGTSQSGYLPGNVRKQPPFLSGCGLRSLFPERCRPARQLPQPCFSHRPHELHRRRHRPGGFLPDASGCPAGIRHDSAGRPCRGGRRLPAHRRSRRPVPAGHRLRPRLRPGRGKSG